MKLYFYWWDTRCDCLLHNDMVTVWSWNATNWIQCSTIKKNRRGEWIVESLLHMFAHVYVERVKHVCCANSIHLLSLVKANWKLFLNCYLLFSKLNKKDFSEFLWFCCYTNHILNRIKTVTNKSKFEPNLEESDSCLPCLKKPTKFDIDVKEFLERF